MKRLALVVVVMLSALPAQAHTEAELESWLTEYDRMREQVEVPPWPSLAHPIIVAWDEMVADMEARHPCSAVLGTPCVQQPTHSTTSSGNRGMGSGVEQWRALVAGYGWDVNTALCLMAKESGGNPNAQNGESGASGLMQVLPSWAPKFGYTAGDLFNPTINLNIAYALYADGGWGHWSPWNRGECH